MNIHLSLLGLLFLIWKVTAGELSNEVFGRENGTISWVFALPRIDFSYEPMCRVAFELAIKKVNDDALVISGHKINVIRADLEESFTDEQKLQSFSETIFDNPSASALLGFINSRHVSAASLIGSALTIPVVAGGSVVSNLSDKDENPMFSRLFAPLSYNAKATAEVIRYAGFKRVGHMGTYTYNMDGSLDSMEEALTNAGIQFIGSRLHNMNTKVSLEILWSEVDTALDELHALGTRVFVYSSIHRDSKFVAWRAYKKGLLGPQPNGEVYSWLFTMDVDGDYAFDDNCIVEECVTDMPKVREALRGSFTASLELNLNQDWLQNEWIPNTTVEKLSADDISLSGTSDWANDFKTRFAVMYDIPFVLVSAINKLCEDHEELSVDDCISHLPSMSNELVTLIGEVELPNAASGSITFDENRDRQSAVKIGQWVDEGIEPLGRWIRDTGAGAIVWEDQPVYASGTSVPPSSLAFISMGESFNNALLIIILFVSLVMIIFTAGLIRAHKPMNLKARSFFNKRLSASITIVGSLQLIFECLTTSNYISPDRSWSPFAYVIEFSILFPLVILLSIIGFRLYRYYRVTHNRRLKSISFGRRIQMKIIIFAIIIPLPSIIYWYLRCVDLVGNDSLEKLFIIQDDDNVADIFTLTTPIYALFEDNRIVLIGITLFKTFYLMIIVGTCALLAKFCCDDGNRRGLQSNKRVMKEMSTIMYVFTIMAMVLFTQGLVQLLANGSNLSDDYRTSVHVGFDNVDSRVTLSLMKTFIYIRIVVGICMWVLFMYIVFDSSLKIEIRKRLYGTSKSTVFTNNSMTGSASTSVGQKLHDISGELLSRLMFSSFVNTGTHTHTHMATNGFQTSTVDDIGGSVIYGSQPKKLPNSNSFSGKVDDISATPSGISYKSSKARIYAPMSQFDRNCAPNSNNQKEFEEHLKIMPKSKLIEVVQKLKGDFDLQLSSSIRMHTQLSTLDSKISDNLLKYEVLTVKLKRCSDFRTRIHFKVGSSQVPTRTSTASVSKVGTNMGSTFSFN
eukprot:TRINITY_DN742_c0_g1_i1.p1 TRINITY_DN742_c0_g1~~TRINITY_DN742_c0_g1_i1.p1  ORF type:complete len:1021 (+),score=228.57 TRINITY_DN742_c0_g1_i1:4567-7629(+)